MTIIIQCNLKRGGFLDVTFDLENNVYRPFRKENNKPFYINKHSNHPPSILKQLPKSIEKQISETSSNKDIFDKSIKPYKDGSKESGYSETLNYISPATNKEQKNRKRKIIWFTSLPTLFQKREKQHLPTTYLPTVSSSHLDAIVG